MHVCSNCVFKDFDNTSTVDTTEPSLVMCMTCTLWLSLGREQSELDILLFKEVLDHISRVDRVLTQPGGSLLMGGRSGVGRRTAVSLVAFMHQITLYTPNVSRNYGVKQFKNDLKNVR